MRLIAISHLVGAPPGILAQTPLWAFFRGYTKFFSNSPMDGLLWSRFIKSADARAWVSGFAR